MSQMQAVQPVQEAVMTPMSTAFKSVPINPYQERAAATRQQVADIVAQNNQQQGVNPIASPTAGAPSQAQSSYTMGTPQAGVIPTTTAQPPAPPAAAQTAPVQTQTQPAPQPAQPQSQQYTDHAVLRQLQALQEERKQMIEALNAQQEQIKNLSATAQEYNTLKQRAELQAAISDEAFGELSSIDSEDAKAISRVTLNAVQQAMAPLYERMSQTKQDINNEVRKQQEQMEWNRLKSLKDKVLAAHPDFEHIQTTPEYHQYMSQRDGLSSQTRDERAAQEFRAGNTDYVIDMLNQFKGAAPAVQSIQTVAPVQAAAVGTVAPSQQAPTMTMRDLNNLYHTGQITPERYKELKPQVLQAWRDAG